MNAQISNWMKSEHMNEEVQNWVWDMAEDGIPLSKIQARYYRAIGEDN